MAFPRVVLGAMAALLMLPVGAVAAGSSQSKGGSNTGTQSATPSFNPQNPNSPFSPGVPQNGAPAPTTSTAAPILAPTTSTAASGGGGLSGSAAAGIGIGALVLLGGISFFIWRDARKRAPVRHGAAAAAAAAGGRSGSKSRTKPRKLSPAERRRRKRGRAR